MERVKGESSGILEMKEAGFNSMEQSFLES